MKSPKKERRVISMDKFYDLHAQAKDWDEVEELLNRLLRSTREKFDAVSKEAGQHTSLTGRKAGVFIIGTRNDIGLGFSFRFRWMDIEGLNADALSKFITQLGYYQLIRSTISAG